MQYQLALLSRAQRIPSRTVEGVRLMVGSHGGPELTMDLHSKFGVALTIALGVMTCGTVKLTCVLDITPPSRSVDAKLTCMLNPNWSVCWINLRRLNLPVVQTSAAKYCSSLQKLQTIFQCFVRHALRINLNVMRLLPCHITVCVHCCNVWSLNRSPRHSWQRQSNWNKHAVYGFQELG